MLSSSGYDFHFYIFGGDLAGYAFSIFRSLFLHFSTVLLALLSAGILSAVSPCGIIWIVICFSVVISAKSLAVLSGYTPSLYLSISQQCLSGGAFSLSRPLLLAAVICCISLTFSIPQRCPLSLSRSVYLGGALSGYEYNIYITGDIREQSSYHP